jgi:subtilase family serine protease
LRLLWRLILGFVTALTAIDHTLNVKDMDLGMGTKPRLWMIATTAAVGLAIITTSARAATTATVRLAGHPAAADLAAAGVTNALAPASNLSMRAVMALRNQGELDQLIEDLQDPSSPDYHRWLTPDEFTARFGPTPEDLAKVSAWLTAQGFTVISASASMRFVSFTGSAAQATEAFQTRLAATSDGRYFANLDGPAVPAEFAGVIQTILGLNNLYGISAAPYPASKVKGSVGTKKIAIGPPDMYAFYDEAPLLTNNINGSHADCIALPEFSDFDDESVTAFDSAFNLPALEDGTNLVRVNVDGPAGAIVNPPGKPSGAQFEALLDVEYAHAAAPQAPLSVYIATTEAPNTAFLDTVQKAVNDNVCGTISLSIGVCSTPSLSADLATTVEASYKQAVTNGQTVFAAAGDSGAAGQTINTHTGACVLSTQQGVTETAASPEVTSVGGTQFKAKFDKSTGVVIPNSGKDVVWHEAIGATGGGASAVFLKPSYQSASTPADGARDIPDISLLAAVQTPGYFYGARGKVLCCGGGTSFASPYWAGIGALMEQLNGGRLGPLNTQLYSLAASNAAGDGIRDVTTGNNSFGKVKGFTAAPGYDQASGWGTPDISVFAHAYTGK